MRAVRGWTAGLLVIAACGRQDFNEKDAGGSADAALDALESRVVITNVVAPGHDTGLNTQISAPIAMHDGRFLIVGAYMLLGTGTDTMIISDDFGMNWVGTPIANSSCHSAQLKFWSIPTTRDAVDNILVTMTGDSDAQLGMFIIELDNVDGIDRTTSSSSMVSSATYSLDNLDVTGDGEHVLAMFATPGEMIGIDPVAPLHKLGDDDGFSVLLADQPASAGTVSPSAVRTTADSQCWAAIGVSLKPKI
ncbi:hypothetical protein BH11MYX2_BH11MYX2_05330 [soil metagenome]